MGLYLKSNVINREETFEVLEALGGFGGFWKNHAREKDNTPKFKKKPRPFQQTSKLTLIIDGIVLIGQV
jgi:hypothetical protein